MSVSISRRCCLLIIILLSMIVVGLALLNFRKHMENLWGHEKELVPRYVRHPVYGESNAFQTFQVVDNLSGSRMRFEVPTGEDSIVETGLVRIENAGNYWGYPGTFRFRVYRQDFPKSEMLFEEVRDFAVNERVSFRIDASGFEEEDGHQKILCEIEKASRDKAKGYNAYEDFAFLVPTVFSKRKPNEFNVVLISIDTLRPDHLGCYGYGRDTSPSIDEFAKNGILFTQAISTSPWTTPAHYSLFTALYPSAHQNKRTFAQPFYSDETLATVLKEHGYYTVAFTGGGSISSEFGFGNGFNLYREYCSYTHTASPTQFRNHENDTEKIFSKAVEWLEENVSTKFFLFLHTYECHIPYEGTFFISKGGNQSLIERRKALYDGDIRKADSYFGRFIEDLRSLNLMSNTIVILVSDHGDDFYDHYREADIIPKDNEEIIPIPRTPEEIIPEISVVDHAHSLYEELVRIPAIFHIPGFKPAKKVLDNQIRIIDIMPTVLDLLNIHYAAPVQGISLVELMQTGKRDEDPPAISEFTDIGPERKSIRMDGYKYIWIQNPDETRYYTLRDLQKHELFDLRKDPSEQENIYDQSTGVAEECHKLLEEQLEASLAISRILKRDRPLEGQEEQEIDEDVLNNLRALGYLQ